MQEKFLEFVAEIMEVEPNEISMETTYNEYEKWDSLMMLTLVMEVEAEYGVSIPLEKVEKIHTLKELYEFVGE